MTTIPQDTSLPDDAIEAAFSTPGGAELPRDVEAWWTPSGIEWRFRQSPAMRAALKGEA